VPAELVIDHSVQVDAFGTRDAFARNASASSSATAERYAFLRWGQNAFERFAVVPPDTGIVHQVNLEYLARVVFVNERDGALPLAYPDTLVGTDSHTTMVNGLGVLGWGVGGIEAEAAMLGQPMSMLIPQVVGFQAARRAARGRDRDRPRADGDRDAARSGRRREVRRVLRPGLAGLPLADRATIGNMSPEFGSTCAIFPIDAETLRYLRFTGRPRSSRAGRGLRREQGLWHDESSPDADLLSDTLELDLGEVEPSLAGPKRPQDRVPLSQALEVPPPATTPRASASTRR
jgi:aconitate hydratase